MESLFNNIHQHKPLVIVCGSHHAMQLATTTRPTRDLDLSSVKILAPLGAAVHPDIVTKLQEKFPQMLSVVIIKKTPIFGFKIDFVFV